jgi:divalent metal cation (Fe/Co/Zn/Cd) transporter
LYEEDASLLRRLNAAEIMQQAKENKKEQLVWDRRFASIVFFVNLLIFAGNLTASILSGSYSVIR